jgi:hypothetical protein
MADVAIRGRVYLTEQKLSRRFTCSGLTGKGRFPYRLFRFVPPRGDVPNCVAKSLNTF